MPIIKGFQSTTVWKAFILNSIASTLVIFVAMLVKGRMDTYTGGVEPHTTVSGTLLTLVLTFITSFTAFTIMYFLFGFGKGMLSA